MTLLQYKSKRNFKESPEPVGGKPEGDNLRFVVQKHQATQLHYDFRLEIDGVLKSWAVPKGPSTDPQIKRLAMEVEDHPFDYRNFEGVIPAGYGAGTVMVWDEGTFQPTEAGEEDKNKQNKRLREQWKNGKIKFVLNGQKLKGEFVLVKSKGREDNAWLLMKANDRYASASDITKQDKSVLSDKRLDEIEKSIRNNTSVPKVDPGHSKKQTSKKAPPKELNETGAKTRPKTGSPSEGQRSKFPNQLSPMLATLVDEPFDKKGWLFEIKWDGYRTLAFCQHDQVDLKSRNNKSYNEKFYPVLKAVKECNIRAVIDGEIVVLDHQGKANFEALQNWRSEADGILVYYVFDLLWLNGKDLMQLPLNRRKELLKELIPEGKVIRLSEHIATSGLEFFEAAKKMNLEGIIAKQADSKYFPGERSKEWLKIKASQRQEMVIGGYTLNDDSDKAFSSLLVGQYKQGKLVYTGKVGTGFKEKQRHDMLKQFKPLQIKTPPFSELPDVNKPTRFRPNPPRAKAIWLKPELICEVSYTEMTVDGVMRHPSFEGMRSDKNAKEVVHETPVNLKNLKKGKSTVSTGILKPAGKPIRNSFLNPTDETQVRSINGHELKFTNLSKVFWPEEGITKRDMLNYYYQVAPFILPYLKDRPQSLNRHPNGIHGKSFYQKDVTGKAPSWIKTHLYHSEGDQQDKHFLVATDEASLLYMASLACIEMNPWSSRVTHPDHPDWCIIDLDPAENTFEQVIIAAQTTKKVLDELQVSCYAKTSGSTGIHVYIPLAAKYTYEQSREFARIIATLVHRQIPEFTSIERVVKARKGKMYIDFLQNRPQATVSAPYSLRPKPGATVSMPLHWDEVKKGLKMTDFNIQNALERIRAAGDIFKPVLGKGINLKRVIKEYKP